MSSDTAFSIKRLLQAGQVEGAAAMAADLIRVEADLDVADVRINNDRYSLNSVNGIVSTRTGDKLFFKFHTEEDENSHVKEYYQASILSQVGLPVDIPIQGSTKPGRQFLLYKFCEDPKLADLCLGIERGEQNPPFDIDQIESAQKELDCAVSQVAISTLSAATSHSKSEPIHQLFHNRLIDPGHEDRLGGRYRSFYAKRNIRIEGKEISWGRFEELRWVINDIEYGATLKELFLRSFHSLNPAALATQPTIVSHGDLHNANVWVRKGEKSAKPKLVFFDPAFAGRNIPVLLGEIKATFHNIFAHPFWLYTPELADDAFKVKAVVEHGRLIITHNWRMGDLRSRFLKRKGGELLGSFAKSVTN